MKNDKQTSGLESIDQLRRELYELIEYEKLSSEVVQKLSRELDELILTYYIQNKL